jgi:DNA-binding NtrC family response regulator
MNPEEIKPNTEPGSGEELQAKPGVEAAEGAPGAEGEEPVRRARGSRSAGVEAQNDPQFSLRSLRAEAEIYAISKTLEYTGWNRRRAAQLLSISYRGILYKIRQHNLTPRSVQAAVEQVNRVNQAVKAE